MLAIRNKLKKFCCDSAVKMKFQISKKFRWRCPYRNLVWNKSNVMPVEGFVFSLKTVVSIRYFADGFFSFIWNFSFLNKLRINKNDFFPFLLCNNSKTITFKRNDILSKLVSKQRSGEIVVSVKWRCCCYCRECWQLNLFKLHRIR